MDIIKRMFRKERSLSELIELLNDPALLDEPRDPLDEAKALIVEMRGMIGELQKELAGAQDEVGRLATEKYFLKTSLAHADQLRGNLEVDIARLNGEINVLKRAVPVVHKPPANISAAHYGTALKIAKQLVMQIHPDKASPDKQLAVAFEHIFKILNGALKTQSSVREPSK
jgi:hypothetical protein